MKIIIMAILTGIIVACLICNENEARKIKKKKHQEIIERIKRNYSELREIRRSLERKGYRVLDYKGDER